MSVRVPSGRGGRAYARQGRPASEMRQLGVRDTPQLLTGQQGGYVQSCMHPEADLHHDLHRKKSKHGRTTKKLTLPCTQGNADTAVAQLYTYPI